MSIHTKRTRDADGALASLNLEAAAAANRRLDVLSPGDANAAGTRLLGFNWQKSAAVATDVEVLRIDAADANRTYRLELLAADANVEGSWRPTQEEASGADVDDPAQESSVGWRIQFGQAGAPCTVRVTADFKGV